MTSEAQLSGAWENGDFICWHREHRRLERSSRTPLGVDLVLGPFSGAPEMLVGLRGREQKPHHLDSFSFICTWTSYFSSSNRKEWTIETSQRVNESQNNAEWKKPFNKVYTILFNLYKILENKTIVTENRSVIALGGSIGTRRDRRWWRLQKG